MKKGWRMRAWIDVETVGGIVEYATESEVVSLDDGVGYSVWHVFVKCILSECEGSKWNLTFGCCVAAFCVAVST